MSTKIEFKPDFEVVLPHTHARIEHCVATGASRFVMPQRGGGFRKTWLTKRMGLHEHLALATFGLNPVARLWRGLMGEMVGYTPLAELPARLRDRAVRERNRCGYQLPLSELQP